MKKRAIILFGSTLVKRHGHWQTAGFERNVPKTAIGGKLRILAAYFLYKKGSVPIIILGGKRREKRFVNTPVIAGITKNELIKLGNIKHSRIAKCQVVYNNPLLRHSSPQKRLPWHSSCR